MTKDEFAAKMAEIETEHGDDPERAHTLADNLLCDMLDELGYRSGVSVFTNMTKYYG